MYVFIYVFILLSSQWYKIVRALELVLFSSPALSELGSARRGAPPLHFFLPERALCEKRSRFFVCVVKLKAPHNPKLTNELKSNLSVR